MTVKAATRGRGLAVLADALRRHRPFTTNGALRASERVTSYGELTPDEQVDLDNLRLTRSVRYVVYSYLTPIAWVTDGGEVHHVRRTFSLTTTKHQHLARTYLGE